MDTSPSATPGPSRRLPIPWNAELLVYLLIELVVAIICLTFDSVNAANFLEVTKWTSAAYLLSRGIAKASRILGD
jgi:hypothetical protein